MPRGRHGSRKASSKSFTGSSAPSPPSLSSEKSMEEHLTAIDHHWTKLTPKSKTFLLEHKSLKTLTWEALMEFWTQPDQIPYAHMAVSVGTCHLLALEYYHIEAYANAAIVALNGAFFQQCINKNSIDELKTLPPEQITRENLPHFHSARDLLSKSAKNIELYLSTVMPVRYQKMINLNLKDQSSLTPGMGYVNLISDDWKTTSNGSHCKQSLSTDGGDIKIILSNQESGVETEKIIKNSTQLKTVFNDYAGEYGESLRSLRFSYNGSTLFLSSLGQKTVNDIGMKDSDVICIYNNNSTLEAEDSTPQQPSMSKKKKCKSFAKRAHQAREKPKSRPIISIPQNNKELQ
eukprot:scaffold5830_cov38-Cyclotella_meneghiniana.AAC.5